MTGLLPGRSVMTKHLTLGYREAQAQCEGWLFRAGEQVRGHEFHFSVWEGRSEDVPCAYSLKSRDGHGVSRFDGACVGNLWASYVHLHFWTKPELACGSFPAHFSADDVQIGESDCADRGSGRWSPAMVSMELSLTSIRVSALLPGTCGELVQGTLDGVPCLVSCPIDRYSTAHVELRPESDWSVPADAPKAAAALRAG